MINIDILTKENFTEHSLSDFRRHQVVTECWRRADGEYILKPIAFVEDWSVERRIEKAAEILDGSCITYGVFDGERVVGFVMLNKRLNCGRLIVESFQISEDYRRRGLGRRLFEVARAEGMRCGAVSLYISACSSKETIAFYRAMGCVLSENPIPELAEDEPCDLQLECRL